MTQSGKNLKSKMYPKVKVRVPREEADQYAYEKSSLPSLKAFDWLSLHQFSSSDDSPGSIARVPRSYIPKSPPPSFLAPKEDSNKMKMVAEENKKNVRATSAPRPRAVISSPDNDSIIGSKTQARKQLLSGLKDHNSCQNRHTQCKIFPKSAAADSFASPQRPNKESAEPKNDIRPKGRMTPVTDSSIRAGGHSRKTTHSSVQS